MDREMRHPRYKARNYLYQMAWHESVLLSLFKAEHMECQRRAVI